MSYTRQEWATALLFAIGNTSPSLQTVQWVVSWTRFETATPPGAAYNLLNTTEPNTPGVVSDFNNAGVKNFDTFAHGIQANAKVLQNGLYETILSSMRSNAISYALTPDGIYQVSTQLTTWGTGPVYASIIAGMGQGMNDSFPGTGPAQLIDPLWTKHLTLNANTGIYKSWILNASVYGSPVSPEYGSPVCQEFEHSTCFWLYGNVYWRIYK